MKLVQKFSTHSYELMRHYKYNGASISIMAFGAIGLPSLLSFDPRHSTWRIHRNGGSSWRIHGEHTPAHHIMSREAPGALSKECSIQWDLQVPTRKHNSFKLLCSAWSPHDPTFQAHLVNQSG